MVFSYVFQNVGDIYVFKFVQSGCNQNFGELMDHTKSVSSDVETDVETEKKTKTPPQDSSKLIDGNNLKILKIMAEQGMEEAVQQMFIRPGDGSRMSYSEMRSYYG